MAFTRVYPFADEDSFAVGLAMDAARLEAVDRFAKGQFDLQAVERLVQYVADVGALLRAVRTAGPALRLMRPPSFAYRVPERITDPPLSGTIQTGFQTNQLRVEFAFWLTVAVNALSQIDPRTAGCATQARRIKALADDAQETCMQDWAEGSLPVAVSDAVNSRRFKAIAVHASVAHDIALAVSGAADETTRIDILCAIYKTRPVYPLDSRRMSDTVLVELYKAIVESNVPCCDENAEKLRVAEYIYRQLKVHGKCREKNAAMGVLGLRAYTNVPPVIAKLIAEDPSPSAYESFAVSAVPARSSWVLRVGRFT